ncbi:MAG: hypothetical protein FIO03_02495 [Nitrosopumilales archaeon]|nr:hypothetical protein [Nitrosopumilales archaeon]
MLSTKSLMHKNPKFAIISTGFMAAVLTLSMLTTAITFSSPLASALTLPGNQTSSTGGKNMTMPGGNMTFVGNMMPRKNMTMPGGNMTFGTSLQNAKMHLMEAIMDLKTGNTKGTMMELNLTAQGIKMHEQEIKSMMMGVKSMMMGMKGNATSPSTMSKNATS